MVAMSGPGPHGGESPPTEDSHSIQPPWGNNQTTRQPPGGTQSTRPALTQPLWLSLDNQSGLRHQPPSGSSQQSQWLPLDNHPDRHSQQALLNHPARRHTLWSPVSNPPAYMQSPLQPGSTHLLSYHHPSWSIVPGEAASGRPAWPHGANQFPLQTPNLRPATTNVGFPTGDSALAHTGNGRPLNPADQTSFPVATPHGVNTALLADSEGAALATDPSLGLGSDPSNSRSGDNSRRFRDVPAHRYVDRRDLGDFHHSNSVRIYPQSGGHSPCTDGRSGLALPGTGTDSLDSVPLRVEMDENMNIASLGSPNSQGARPGVFDLSSAFSNPPEPKEGAVWTAHKADPQQGSSFTNSQQRPASTTAGCAMPNRYLPPTLANEFPLWGRERSPVSPTHPVVHTLPRSNKDSAALSNTAYVFVPILLTSEPAMPDSGSTSKSCEDVHLWNGVDEEEDNSNSGWSVDQEVAMVTTPEEEQEEEEILVLELEQEEEEDIGGSGRPGNPVADTLDSEGH